MAKINFRHMASYRRCSCQRDADRGILHPKHETMIIINDECSSANDDDGLDGVWSVQVTCSVRGAVPVLHHRHLVARVSMCPLDLNDLNGPERVKSMQLWNLTQRLVHSAAPSVCDSQLRRDETSHFRSLTSASLRLDECEPIS